MSAGRYQNQQIDYSSFHVALRLIGYFFSRRDRQPTCCRRRLALILFLSTRKLPYEKETIYFDYLRDSESYRWREISSVGCVCITSRSFDLTRVRKQLQHQRGKLLHHSSDILQWGPSRHG